MPVADDTRVLAIVSHSRVCAARSRSSVKMRPGRKFPFTHLTNDSTLPFWFPALGSQAWGWKLNSAASWSNAGVQRG